MTVPGVSFIILNWRKPEKTLAAIQSIRAQSGAKIEVIIVDNESEKKHQKKLRSVSDTLIINDSNLGFAAACNQGAARAKGSILAFVNNDAILSPDWLKLGLAVLQDTTFDAVSGGEGLPDGRVYGVGRVNPRTAMVNQSLTPIQEVTSATYAYGSNLLINMSAFKKVGGFEESYFAYYEDVDLAAKLSAHGLQCAMVPGMEIGHEVGASTGDQGSSFRNNLIQRNKYRYIARHFPAWLFFVIYTSLYDVLKYLVGTLVLLIRPGSHSDQRWKQSVYRAQLSSAGWAITHIPMLWQARRSIRTDGHYDRTLRRRLSQTS